MLKRVGHILIIFLLLFGTTGMTITKHYCGRHLVHTAIYSTPDNCCKGNCPGCHNEKITIPVTDQYESTQAHIDFNSGMKLLLEKNSLPTILAFSNLPEVSLFDGQGGHRLKPFSTKPITSGANTPLLQVFLF
jgi:hypothetical protein